MPMLPRRLKSGGVLDGLVAEDLPGKQKGVVMTAKVQQFFLIVLLIATSASAQQAKSAKAPATADWKDADAAMGRPGQDQPDGTHKYALPRKDLNVMLNGVQIKAGLALGSWVAFKSTSGDNAMVMGDLVLLEDEVAPVMQELQSGG